MKRILKWFAILFIGAASLGGAIDGRTSPEQRAAPQKQTENDLLLVSACNVAQRAVTSQLTAPSIAKFPSCAFSVHEYRFTTDKDRKVVFVQGYVDVQNGSSAMIRTLWTVKLKRREDGTGVSVWTVMRVTMEG